MNSKNIKNVFKNSSFAAFTAAILLYAITIIFRPTAFNVNSIAGILASTMLLAMATSGQTLVVITGGIDLSVGAMMSLGAIVAGQVMMAHNNATFMALIACLIVGAICGLINGFGVVICKLPPLIMTLCFAGILSRIQFVMTGGTPYGTSAPLINKIMVYRIFGVIPMVAVIGLIFFAIMFYLLKRSRFGIQIFLAGSNDTAAHFAGINTKKIRVLAYTACGLLSGLGGFVTCAYMQHISCNIMDSYTMMSIAAVVIGGTILAGGKGTYVGSAIGALMLIVLSNFLTVFTSGTAIRNIVMGLVLLLLLAIYNRSPKIRL